MRNDTTDLMLWNLFDPFDFDKKFYNFNREEKDMHPYSILNKEDATVLTHNVLGLNKEDIQLSKKKENGVAYIVIAGKTTDEVTGKTYSINSRFSVDENKVDLSKVSSTMKNGLLYITIPYKKEDKEAQKESFIKIN
jgi:HSP20 family molecular chaperone IbpA